MTLLVLARGLIGRPVVTLHGDDVAQIKDVVVAPSTRSVLGFTLAGRALLSGPMREALPWGHVHSVGRHAVMILGSEALTTSPGFDTGTGIGTDDGVIGEVVLTRSGTALGQVTDLVIDAAPDDDRSADDDRAAVVVGFEIITSDALPPAGRRALIPREHTPAPPGETIIVTDRITDYLAEDLAGFATAVTSWQASAHKKAN